MKIVFKTLKKEEFEVEAEPTETIGQLKAKIEELKGASFYAEGLKLIHSGVVLADTATIESCNLKPTDFIVVMAKPRPVASAPTAAAPATTTTTTPAATTTATASTTAAAPRAPVAPAAGFPTPSDEQISNLMGMGDFSRDQVISALRAAFNNADRAVEYLFNGLPAGAETGAAAPPTATGSSTGAAASTTAAAPPAAAGSTTGPLPALSPTSPLAMLVDNPSFQQLRQVVQSNPALLPALLQEIGRVNPELVQILNQNREDFYLLLNMPVGSGAGGAGGRGGRSGSQMIQVTPEENAAIERLCALGFDKSRVIQAYFACDKNENLAANYLLSGNDD